MLETSLIHRLWEVVDMTSSAQISALGDIELTQLLTAQLSGYCGGNEQEILHLQDYINERILLIRDLASSGP